MKSKRFSRLDHSLLSIPSCSRTHINNHFCLSWKHRSLKTVPQLASSCQMKLSKGTMVFRSSRLSFESRCLLHSLWTFFALQKSSCLLIDKYSAPLYQWRWRWGIGEVLTISAASLTTSKVRSKCTMNLRLVRFVHWEWVFDELSLDLLSLSKIILQFDSW